MPQIDCPPSADLERLFLGPGPEEEMLALEQHLLQCNACLEKLKALLGTRETLAGLLRHRPPADPFRDSPLVANLLQALHFLRTSPTAFSHRSTALIATSCPLCHKKLLIKEDLAGKRVKCPGCGRVITVPAKAAAVRAGDPTLPPRPAPASAGPGPQAPTDVSGRTTPAPVSPLEATRDSSAPDTGHDSSLTDFLTPPQADDELGRLGKYRILKVLGHGGMGVVYRAEDPLLKRTVAIKAMLPALAASASAGQRFLREAQAMAAVKHDHIVTIYQVDEARGVPFLAMEFLEGEPLDERLRRETKLPVAELLRIGREIAEGLAAAHERGLIHRDIKPGNVWLEGRRQRVKVLDFGLARAAAQEAALTQQGAIIGTPAYMAPEQARGDPVDARSDLFSLGVILYQMGSGRQPFQGKDTVSMLMAVATQQPVPPRQVNTELPAGLSDLVMQLLEKDADRRPASAADVVQALQALEQALNRPGESRTVDLPLPPPVAARGRRRLPVLIGALLLLAGVLGLGALALIRITTDHGDYVITTDDPDFSFQVGKGTVTLRDAKTGHTYRMEVKHQDQAAGENELEVADGDADLTFHTRTFTIRRGQQVALKAWFERKPTAATQVARTPAPAEDPWLKEVARLPVDQQVEAVVARLQQRNPDWDGAITPKIEGGVVTGLQLLTHHVTDLTPLRAFSGLRTLSCPGTEDRKGQLASLAPLKGLKLTVLDCSYTNVFDLSPLKEMPLTILKCGWTRVSDLSPLKSVRLTELWCEDTQVSDLTPLKDMRLAVLVCRGTPVSDLTPLQGMKLRSLDIGGTGVADLSPLKDMKLNDLDCTATPVSTLAPLKEMKLTGLWCIKTQVSDLTPLKGMPLTCLDIRGSPVSDLRPLKEMPLTELRCTGTRVSDLSPLKGLPLKWLWCDFEPKRDAEILRSIKTLEMINDKPASEFWKDVGARSSSRWGEPPGLYRRCETLPLAYC